MIPVRQNINRRVYSGKLAAWLAATAAAALTTFLLTWLRANSTTAGMVFLVLVVWSAAQAGRWLPFYLAALCALSFDYFFLPPYHTLWLEGPQAWVEMLAFVASCVVVSRVAERARRQTRQAEQRREDVERLYELSQQLMLYEDAEALVRDLPRLIDRIFGLEGVVLYVCDQDKLYASISELPMGMEASLRTMSQNPHPTITIHASYHATPLMLGLRPLGALGWQPAALSREVAAAVSAQVAIVLARAIAIATSTRIEAAREGERLRTALIDSLTHELRTPLTSIRAAATTLMEGRGLDEDGRLDLAAIIDEEAARLDLLIGEAVEMAQIDAQGVEIHMVPHHPRALLDQAVAESRSLLAAHRVSISVEEPDEPAWFDPHLLGRVLRHLLENAAAHTPAGTGVRLGSKRSGERLEFFVEDEGPGIDALDLPLIFEKFYRGQRGPAAGKRKGSGMGLAITRAIVNAHGGGIEASSHPGQGASFRFWVPLVEKELRGKA
jgi:two-component system sensor histidine kinase KdpD